MISGSRSAGNFNYLIDNHLAEFLPDGRRVIIEYAGHEMFHDNPEDSNRAITDFLESIVRKQ